MIRYFKRSAFSSKHSNISKMRTSLKKARTLNRSKLKSLNPSNRIILKKKMTLFLNMNQKRQEKKKEKSDILMCLF